MAYLHENREEFTNAVNLASEYFHILPIIAEKDYYVTMILRELSERQDFIVFKGGTSLSKCYKAIKRFSEDIDITIDSKLTQGQMKKLKESIKAIAEQLGMTIPNIDETRSKNRCPGPGQIDLFEGTVTTEQAQNASIPDEFKNYAVADVVYRSIGMGYCNVLCFYKMDYKVVGRNLIDFQLGEMDEFGKYVVIIDDMSELERRIYLAARKQGFKCLCGPVRYRELKLNGGDIKDLKLERQINIRLRM